MPKREETLQWWGRPLSRTWRTGALLGVTSAAMIVAGCSSSDRDSIALGGDASALTVPMVMAPQPAFNAVPGAPRPADAKVIDLTQPGAVVWETATPVIESTLDIAQQIQPTNIGNREPIAIGDVLNANMGVKRRHDLIPAPSAGEANNLPVGNGGVPGVPNIKRESFFPGISQTPWVPPDPTLAVGPNHVLMTVNMAVAWYNKSTGAQQFISNLDNTGNPGFFESIGAGNFTFDPKCFYDHYVGRFVIIVPEVYGSTEAWLCIAVSDDSDPNGTWYKYRTNAVVTVGSSTYWVDYPGFGYDQNGYYVTGNLFGLNTGGFGGAFFRVFDKTPLLSGQPVTFATLRDGNGASVQASQNFGSSQAPFFVSINSSSSLRIQAIVNPLTNPQLTTTTVSVPAFGGVGSAPAPGGSVGMIDGRILNVHWRGGNLYAAHDSNVGGTNVARWYHLNTNNWPTSGAVTFVQAGNVNPGGGKATFFPAIYSNKFGDVAMVVGASSASERISVNGVGRRATDPAGTMGPLTQFKLSDANGPGGGGRWGDYQDIAIDPSDDTRFWIIGEYINASGAWQNWLDSFTITTQPGPFASDDSIGVVFNGVPTTVDVLANDSHSNNLAIVIDTFQGTSANGGTIVRSVGTGPGGRDQLIYTAAVGYTGPDTFTYTIKDPNNLTATATVTASVLDESQFRDADSPVDPQPGIEVDWYAFSTNQSSMPNFSALTPYASAIVTQLNLFNFNLTVFNSGRSDRVGGVFTGFIEVPSTDFYNFYLTSNDGANMYIGDTLFINNDHTGSTVEVSGNIGLKAGKHQFRIEYFENTGQATLRLEYAGGGLSRQVIPTTAYSFGTLCAADFDGSGFVDSDDYDAYVNAFEAGDISADFDGTGFVDGDDFDAFVNAFELGC